MESKISVKKHQTNSLVLYYIGPEFNQKAKTALYFSLSGEESLTTNPFAKPAILLAEKGYRVISATLPGHEDNARPEHIRPIWGESPDLLERFFFQMENALIELKDDIEGDITALGLSRGAFIATHLAARIDEIDRVVGFAPLTFLEEAPALDLIHLKDMVKNKKIRFSIGHNDTLVSTKKAIETISTFIDSLSAKQLQECSIQLIITPSIGRNGHGTSDKTFASGVEWVLNEREA